MVCPSQRQVTQGPQSLPSGPEQQKRSRVSQKKKKRGGPSVTTTNTDNDNNSKDSIHSTNLHPGVNVDDKERRP